MNIAILEEDANVGDMLKHGLKLAGYSTVVFSHPSSFFAALLAAASTPFDCIIVDLPLKDGMSREEVVQQVGQSFSALPVILIVDGSSWEVEAARKSTPGIEVLRKPFKLTTLLSLLKNFAS